MRTAILLCTLLASAASAGPISGWAIVNADGSVARGSHVASAINLSSGNYVVDFDRAVRKCTFTATLGDANDGSLPGYVTVAAANEQKAGVYVVTFDQHGAPTDRGFHLNVRC